MNRTLFRTIACSSAAVLAWIAFAYFHAPAVDAHTRITTDVTWSGEIREILRQKCMSCHHPGGMAPDYVDLTRYGTDTEPGARAWAVAIEEEILTGRMPPWKADPRFRDFANSKMLTDEEIDYIIAWVRGGAPQGPERNLPTPPEFLERDWIFGQPDQVFKLPKPHRLASDTMTDTVTMTFPVEIEEDTWITGYEFFPENPEVIYSMTALIHDPQDYEPQPLEVAYQVPFDPLASEEEREQTRLRDMPNGPHFLGQWVRGDYPVLLPDDGGKFLPKGSTIELQIQYERPIYADPSLEILDQSRLGLFFALENEEIDLLVESTRIAREGFKIPAGSPREEVSAEYAVGENVHLLGFHPHLGPLAKTLRVNIQYPDGMTNTVMWIPEYKHLYASSYQFEKPIPAPEGSIIQVTATYDNSEDNWDNPNYPPKDVIGGEKFGPARFAAWIDYLLDDHLIIEREFVPRLAGAPEGTGMSLGMLAGLRPDESVEAGLPDTGDVTFPIVESIAERITEFIGPDGQEIYWCPMRGNPCEIKDYHGPGECDDCWMDLKPKRSFFEGTEIAPGAAEWKLADEGMLPIYWCPNRGRDDHALVDYSQPARCPVCAAQLAHKTQFEIQRTWACITPVCDRRGDIFYGPGLCPSCGQPVAGMGHMDHTPVHGGWQFFMADNLYHHLEGTMPENGVFRMYFYDDWKTPLDARNFAGTLYIEDRDPDTGAVIGETEYPLVSAKEGDTFLTAHIPPDLPVDFYTMVWLAGEQKRFDFEFDELTKAPERITPPTDIRLHTHIREPIAIPPTVDGIVREILRRDRIIVDLIGAKDWFAIHYPAFDAKDYVAALANRQDGLNIRQRGQLKTAIGLINRGANALDRGGDMADEPRVRQAYTTFQEGIDLLKEIYPDITP